MIISSGVKIKCKKCNKLYDINPEDFGEPDTSSDERNMGYEIQYSWEYEFACEKCDNHIHIYIDGYEYPTGILNYEEFNSEGCSILENPSLEIDNDDYELD